MNTGRDTGEDVTAGAGADATRNADAAAAAGDVPATESGLHPILAARSSPARFDPDHELSTAQEELLLEAARWAPSAGNSQPWLFHLRRRGSAGYDLLVNRLAGSSRLWAPDASALVVNIAHHTVEDSGMPYTEFAAYDLGQAVAHMTLQATAMGLACRQFRAFDLEGLTGDLAIPPGWEIMTMTALGRTAEAVAGRERRSRPELRLPDLDPP